MRYFSPSSMVRPVWEDLLELHHRDEYVECPCGDWLQTESGVRAHWDRGHFDVPMGSVEEEGAVVA